MATSISLNVICLISGGKDSFFSLIHCLRNGHNVVALGNLYPPGSPQEDDHDLNSHMYQTAGHTILSLYSRALEIPLYRASIRGEAVKKGRYYTNPAPSEEADETESLIPLLQQILQAHPEANALSAGAILSTYQRTRIESIAVRLRLTPLAYLWQYPLLPGSDVPDTLLDDMRSVGLDARIVKVASGGLDERVLWGNVVGDGAVRERVRKGVGRFGGSVLGEGGEYETIVIDGPREIFKKAIVVPESGTKVVRGEGGEAWLWLDENVATTRVKATLENTKEQDIQSVRTPGLWDTTFEKLLIDLNGESPAIQEVIRKEITPYHIDQITIDRVHENTTWSISNLTATESSTSAASQMQAMITELDNLLSAQPSKPLMTPSSIVFTTILLRNMQDFASINTIYATLFPDPNPPARVTIACGDTLPENVQVMVSFILDTGPTAEREGLHVQSRSYWAPANIGPYSQAISVPISTQTDEDEAARPAEIVYVAGQIPLVPSSMEVMTATALNDQFTTQTILSLQHLFRIGVTTQVDWWIYGVAFLSQSANSTATRQKASLASRAWTKLHLKEPDPSHSLDESDDDDDDDDDNQGPDAWDLKYGTSRTFTFTSWIPDDAAHTLPNFSILNHDQTSQTTPPFLAVEVDELPRACDIEWQGLGARTGKQSLRISVPTDQDDVSRTTEVSFCNMRFVFVGIPDTASDEQVTACLGRIRDQIAEGAGFAGASGERRRVHVTIYTAGRCAKFLPRGQIVPCRSVWGADGERLACAMIIRGEK